VIWPTIFGFSAPPDVAWEEVKAALASIGGVVTSEDFRTLLIKRRSPVEVVELKLAVRPGATDETSVLVVDQAIVLVADEVSVVVVDGRRRRRPLVVVDGRRRRRPSLSGGNPQGWQGLESLSDELLRVVRGLDYLCDPLVSGLRTEEFHLALKGYNVDEVDEFLEALAARIEIGESLFPEDVISNEFRISWKGYDKQDVDGFLERVAAAIDTQSH